MTSRLRKHLVDGFLKIIQYENLDQQLIKIHPDFSFRITRNDVRLNVTQFIILPSRKCFSRALQILGFISESGHY